MNEKQQQLTFGKGITNVPSDALCSDNALEESLGMIYEDGEHRVIQKPVQQMQTSDQYTSATILYIHKYNNEKRYIYYNTIRGGSPTLAWGVKNNSNVLTYSGYFSGIDISDIDKLHITSIGKALIIDDGSGKRIFLQNENGYTEKSNIPDLSFSCYMWSPLDIASVDTLGVTNSLNINDMVQGDDENRTIKAQNQANYNDAVIGLYLKNLNALAHKGSFSEPFFVRLALELYDGTYTYITQPVLMFPSVTGNSWIRFYGNDKITMSTSGLSLFIIQTTDYSELSDIVKDVVVFVTEQVHLYDTTEDQPLTYIPHEGFLNDAIQECTANMYSKYYVHNLGNSTDKDFYQCLKAKGNDQVVKEILGKSVFYKLCSIGIKPIACDVASRLESHVLENITTQEFLKEDDYFSRSNFQSNFLYSYNSRLNIANVKRGFFNGFDFFLPFDKQHDGNSVFETDAYTYDFYVTIKTDTGIRRVKHTKQTWQKQGIYFFYPDSRATHVVIYRGSVLVCSQDLTEHPSLNGAYFFRGLPGAVVTDETTTDTPTSIEVLNAPELLPNYIIQSEVNNPFVFKAAGYFKVGTGEVMAMSTITQAISEGQFGQFPLLVFSESGIWSLSVASTGYYDSIHPMSREVCNNVKSITQTDGAVFFTSEKGLMVVVGNQVKCVSEQLSGKEGTFNGCIELGNFHDYLKKCFIAYDYRDSLLWIFSTETVSNIEVPYDYCWIYSIKSGTFGKYYTSKINQVVNDYPDYLLSNYSVFLSLLDRPNINLDGDIISDVFNPHKYNNCRLITRPMKLENAFALKSIMQIKHIHQFSPYLVTDTSGETPVTTTQRGTLSFRLFASNNLEHWVELHSLRGTPWKYYRFRYDFTNLIATDRFSGTMLITQERRTNKLR